MKEASGHLSPTFLTGRSPVTTPAPCLGLVERLRNGGQSDLADMAERRDFVLRQIFYACQWEQLMPGSFNFAECETKIREAMK